MTATSTATAANSIDLPNTSAVSTRVLLFAGAVAGPLFALLAAGQVLLRDGFDLRRHPLSLLATGGPGFVQIINFLLAGLGVVCLAIAVRRTVTDGVGRRWLARLIAVFGLGLIASGVFVMDPENGFPIGTTEEPASEMSWHGIAHIVAATVAFTGLAVACIVLTVRMVAAPRRLGGGAECVRRACLSGTGKSVVGEHPTRRHRPGWVHLDDCAVTVAAAIILGPLTPNTLPLVPD